jgi:predicted nucleic acid-binding protein
VQTTANVLFSIPPRVVIDTNALLVSISSRSASHILFSALQAGKYVICCSNDIIEEYAEIIAKLWDNTVSSSVINTLLMLANLERIEVYYH